MNENLKDDKFDYPKKITFQRYYRACYGVVRFVMESGAKGVEVVVSGKLRGARAKAMKFVDGFMVRYFYIHHSKHIHQTATQQIT